ncbi:MAG: molecular chaperone [Acidimicrobiia bacterium]
MTSDTWVEVAQLRRGLYRFLGGVFLPPSEERVEGIVAAAGFLHDLGMEHFSYYTAWLRLLDVIDEMLDLQALEAEYIRLFASGTDKALCPLNEAFFRTDAKSGESAKLVADVQRHIQELGLSTAGAAESPDHLASELEVMSALCAREAGGWSRSDILVTDRVLKDEERFLRVHLSVWLPPFRARVASTSPESFYGAAVEMTHAFVLHDVDYLHATRTHLGGPA